MNANPKGEIQTALSVRALQRGGDPVAFIDALDGLPCRWLLDSSLLVDRLGRFSFAGAEPYAALRTFGTRSVLETFRSARPDLPVGCTSLEGHPLALLRSLLPPAPTSTSGDLPRELPFVGGAVGYFGYELACQLEDLALCGRDDLRTPDQTVLLVDRLLAFDHVERRAFAVGLGFSSSEQPEPEPKATARAARASDWIRDAVHRAAANEPRPLERAGCRPPRRAAAEAASSCAAPREAEGVDRMFDEPRYVAAVERVKRHIRRGDLYQANLTHRMQRHIGARPPFELYCSLRAENPAPFAAYLELPEIAILSSSPERFLQVDSEVPDGTRRRVESRPIKGTRPRGASDEADAALASALAGSEKDRAENLMIVDLVRNDLGRVCETGSVEVPELRAIERYATVFQMVSTVTGRLSEDSDAIDLVAACFPPGSMTGAPKLAAMKLLDAIEPVRRGVYSGALGYLDVRGGLDLSVIIRTILVQDGHAYVHVGGAVVADSEPVAEYRETLDKAHVLLEVLRDAGEAVAPRPAVVAADAGPVDVHESAAKVW